MASRYYILNSSSLSTIENDLEYTPVWNVSGSEFIIEVAVGYSVAGYLNKFTTSNDCQDYINNPIRIDEWYQPDVSELP